MKRTLTLAVALAFLTTSLVALSGCLIRTNAHSRKSCGPAYHWDGGRCVHNGKAKGHKSNKSNNGKRDHRH